MSPTRWVTFALLLTTLACTGGNGTSATFRGAALPSPLAKPAITLTDVNGQPYDLLANTRDKVALVFFGYTHCPDVCPLHMANIAAVLRRMSAEDRARVTTIFVTTDPERDTPERLRTFLANFDPSFVGLTGTREELRLAQAAVGLGEATREYVNNDSANYFVSHGAQVFAFARDGNAYTVYPFGIRQEDWANDLPLLVNDATGENIRRTLAAQVQQESQSPRPEREVSMGGLMVTQAVVAEPTGLDEAAAYLTFRNDTPQSDTIIAITADVAVRGEIHETLGDGDMRHMMAVPTFFIPARAQTSMVPGAKHIMLHQLRRSLKAGDTVTLLISLAHAGALQVRAGVVPYADLEKALGLTPVRSK
jgi:protein SCO1/2